MPLPEDFPANTEAKSSQLRQLLRWFRGDPNQGLRALLTNTNEDAYVFDMANQHSTGKAIRVSNAAGVEMFHAHAGTNGEAAVVASPDGTQAAPVVTTTHVQTLTGKTLQDAALAGRTAASVGDPIQVGASGSTVLNLATPTLKGNVHTITKAAAVVTANIASISGPPANGAEIELRFFETGINVLNNGTTMKLNGDFTSSVGGVLKLRYDSLTTPATPYWYEISRNSGGGTGNQYARLTVNTDTTVSPSSVNFTFGSDVPLTWKKDSTVSGSVHDGDTAGFLTNNGDTVMVAPSVGLYQIGFALAIKPPNDSSLANDEQLVRVLVEATTGSAPDTYLVYFLKKLKFNVNLGAQPGALYETIHYDGLVRINTTARRTFRVSVAMTSLEGAAAGRNYTVFSVAQNLEASSHFWIRRVGD